jgi:hypothetical protein
MRIILCLTFLALSVATALAQDVTEYRQLRGARPDGRTIPVKGLTITRDGYRIELRSGVVHLLAPFGSDTFGAVFIGEGVYQLNPATAAERRHLSLVTGNDRLEVLTDRFTRSIFLFTDRTAAELLAHAPAASGAPDPAATRIFDDYIQKQLTGAHPNLHLRVLADLLNRPARTDGVFLAFVEGQSHSPVLLAVDPLGISNLTSRFAFFGGEEVALVSFNNLDGGLWYSSALAGQAVDGRGKAIRSLADATHYDIDTVLDGGALRGTTTITFTTTVDGVRVLPIHLFERLRIRTATIERDGTQVQAGILQEEPAQGWAARLFGDEVPAGDVAILFREPLARGATIRLTLEYEGRDVLQGSDGRFVVRARESWYPNLGTFSDLATYATTFRYSQRHQLVGVGELVSERVEGGQKVAFWRSQVPIRVAGFNYGEFQKQSREDAESGVQVNVYAIRGSENFTAMAGNALADAVNTSRVATLFFGAAPYRHLSITQQPQMNFGQSWPSLVFLPSMSFVSATDVARNTTIDPRALQGLKEFGNTVAWHEVAHQWWGHQIGWSSYRDQWLSEGLAEFTSALMLEVTAGRKAADGFWELRRGEVLDRGRGVPNTDAGAITQGFRLATSRSPGAARAMLYSKGAYVVHMLRMMMREDRVPDPDRLFKAMMQDFVKSWSGKNPSTDDFQAVAERHMTRGTNLAGDGKLTYFFNQWVHGTAVPTLSSDLQVTDLGQRKYRISGTITQAGVTEGFRTPVPIYLDFGDEKIERLGLLPLSGPVTQKVSVEIELPQRPRRVVINARHDVLSR